MRGGRLGSERAFWAVAAALAVAMATANVPTPLYPLLQERDGFGPPFVATIFACYAAGVIATLLLLGRASDRLGRRAVLVPALLLGAVACGVFALWHGEAGLVLARVLCGLAVGVITAAATAHVVDLDERARGRRDGGGHARAEIVSTAATLGGLGLGPLAAGLLAGYVAGPLTTPFWISAVLLVLAAGAVAAAPETVSARGPRRLVQSVRVRAAGRGVLAAWLGLFAAYAVQGFTASLAPGLLADATGRHSPALAGAVACLLYVTAAVAQIAFRARTRTWLLARGMLGLALGLSTMTAGMWSGALALVLAGSALSGLGIGGLTRGCIATVTALAPPDVRGEALAGLFLAGYVGLALPVLGLGAVSGVVADRVALLGFAAVVLLALTAAASLRAAAPRE